MLIISCGPANISATKSFCRQSPNLEKVNSFEGNASFSQEKINNISKSIAIISYDKMEICTATAIGEDTIVTASHCLSHGRANLENYIVRFNYIENEDGFVDEENILSYHFKEIISEGNYIKLHSPDALIVKLDRKLDSSVAISSFSKKPVKTGQAIAIMQHPDGRTLEVGAGSVKKLDNGVIYYSNISTQSGSSGAAIFNEDAEIVGIHVRGGCSLRSLDDSNKGVSLGLLSEKLDWFKKLRKKIDFKNTDESVSKISQ